MWQTMGNVLVIWNTMIQTDSPELSDSSSGEIISSDNRSHDVIRSCRQAAEPFPKSVKIPKVTI